MYKIVGADKKEYGPVTVEQLRQWLSEGRVNSQTLVWSEVGNNWKPLSAYPEISLTTPPLLSSSIPPLSVGGSSPHVPNYLIQAILCTLCCCLPFGVVAIIYAAQVNSKLESGDYQGALISSNNARLWCWIAFALGLVSFFPGLLYFWRGGFSSFQHTYHF
ncbi:MAG: CD225/dispanin family protein [Verrucomicrobiota bacterium]|nr:CD225/dispanin family protein [Verrucomicrobiota bacterium]